MRYRLRTLLLLLAVLPPAIALPFCWPFVSIEAVFQIQTGMTQAEVKTLVGGPMNRSRSFDGSEYWTYYTGPLNAEMVEFDQSGRVVNTWSH